MDQRISAVSRPGKYGTSSGTAQQLIIAVPSMIESDKKVVQPVGNRNADQANKFLEPSPDQHRTGQPRKSEGKEFAIIFHLIRRISRRAFVWNDSSLPPATPSFGKSTMTPCCKLMGKLWWSESSKSSGDRRKGELRDHLSWRGKLTIMRRENDLGRSPPW
jgi:hypothetical protein